jgi:hypothetical protein
VHFLRGGDSIAELSRAMESVATATRARFQARAE